MAKYTIKQKIEWFDRSLKHLEECQLESCGWYWDFKKYLQEIDKTLDPSSKDFIDEPIANGGY